MTAVKEQTLDMVATIELLQKVGGEWNASDKDPLGPTDDCFSPEGIVYLSRRGATMRDIYHLSRCQSCRTWMSNFVQVKAKIPGLAKSKDEGRWWHDLMAYFRSTEPVLNEPNTVLYVPFTELEVRDLTQPNLSLKLGILSAPSGNFDAIDASSLRLCGGLTGGKATLLDAEELGFHYRVACFEKVGLGQAAKEDLAKHQAASHTVCLSGLWKGMETQEIKGEAYVNLLRG